MIIRSGRDAAYRQLADLLRAEITSGRIGPGQLLPYEGRLQQEYGVGRGVRFVKIYDLDG
ncbi:GntR family transcriptional regulator [Micromonospora sp. HM5-17]|jgi:GntR family transcriptional regulator|uniref:GntR family transcriptional regulator n=1 Tax=Micromonospora sp. HM5-17 TaxID=2487710 RepID=UPI000F49EED9|nr:GntR family transcriptional regulator [Micromonospora sp. HM5-17]ROT33800.1 GntR family transcriptional regulator [Micromonospora sp. HM5-17]